MPGKYNKNSSEHKKQVLRPADPQKLYRSLHDQLDRGHLDNALKTCNKLLKLNPDDSLAAQTRIQVLIALDRYPQALSLLQAEDTADSLSRAYCLYKTARENEARSVLAQLPVEQTEDRSAKLLEAQVSYRLEEYERARDQFEDLAAMVDDESPELDDLQSNIAACNAHLDFLSAVPTHMAASTSNTGAPTIDDLENAPVGPLIHSNPLFRTSNAGHAASSSRLQKGKGPAGSTSESPIDASAAAARPRPKRLPKNYDPAKTPDPWRWTKLKERPGMGEVIQSKREKARGKNKDRAAKERAALLTQGGQVESTASSTPAVGGSASAKKKKKGKK